MNGKSGFKPSRILILLLPALFIPAPSRLQSDSLVTVTKSLIMMGTAFSFTVRAENDTLAWKGINAGIEEVNRIENLISTWKPESQASAINFAAGKQPVKIDIELFQLFRRSNKVSQLTDGAFDVSFAAIEPLWKFDGSMNGLPSDSAIASSVKLIGWENIIMNDVDTTVMLKYEGMRIGFGAIGKGYAANRASLVIKETGIQHGIVNAAGDLIAWGTRDRGQPWTIGIADPSGNGNVIALIDISETAVATSGNYEKFAEIGGRRFGHIIDPHTGWPSSGLTSVTIVCPDAEIADALATAVFVLGAVEGLELVEKLKGVECFLIDDLGNRHISGNFMSKAVVNDANK